MVFLFQLFKLNVQFPFQNNMSNIPAEFHFLRKAWFRNPVLRSKLDPTRPCENRPKSVAKEYLVGQGGGYRNWWRQPRKDIFQRVTKEDEGGGKR